MTICEFISNILFRKSKHHKIKSHSDNKEKRLDLSEYHYILKRQEERIKQLEQKYSNLEKRIKLFNYTTVQKNETKDEKTSSSTISWIIQQPNEQTEVDLQNNFIQLSIQSGGRLKQAEIGDTIYYKAWKEKGQIYFIFVNSNRTKKAINNRTTIIEPFCDNVGNMKSPNNADSIEIVKEGVLNSNFQVLEKVKIKYV
ncbi:hypothetical protein Bacsa_0868 [Phocaeicola salanitronis DSM 18170]|uniref:Uncharacterized protein n=1 Tax=Phocaeicola salanitronis (strain DSM 18170 / JCM 13657 / CCUG 60908 / BL78) TaxID=667015 RepID=F0R2R6_PHOSB|nr:hypothetical protein [Phocaeicola salanitronis]ADY35461.1 hypothetical protein Bacsa_0868 [Phocaeicola salanitronis DSM 18170]